jgi:uncharacterized integral membrane protein
LAVGELGLRGAKPGRVTQGPTRYVAPEHEPIWALAAIRVSSELLEVVEETNMVKLIVGGVLSVLVLIFIVQNTQSVDVTFLAWTITVSRALLLIIILLFGITVGWIVGGIRQQRSRSQKREKDPTAQNTRG